MNQKKEVCYNKCTQWPYKNIGHVAEIVKVDLKGSTKSITIREADYPKPGIYERTITGNSFGRDPT